MKYIWKEIEKKYTNIQLKAIKKVLAEDSGLKTKFDKLNKDLKIKIDYDSLKLLRLQIKN